MEHSEFPWGPEPVPGLLTPMGVFGWMLAAALALMLLYLIRTRTPGKNPRVVESRLEDIYKHVLAAARYAVRQDEYGIMQGADTLRRTVRDQIGGVLMAGGLLGKHLKTLGETLGEGDDKGAGGKPGKKKPKDGHRPDEGRSVVPPPAPPVLEPVSATTVAETIRGHAITLNIGTDVVERPSTPQAAGSAPGHDPHPPKTDDEEACAPTLEQQLQTIRKAVRDFEAWWSDKPARMAELRAARDDLNLDKPLDPVLEARIQDHGHGSGRNSH